MPADSAIRRFVTPTLNLPILSLVRVWRENKGWIGPYKLLGTNEEECTIQMPYGITRFRCTVVKPYYHNSDQLIPENKDIDNDNRSVAEDTQGCDFDLTPSDSQQGLLVKRGRGRPKGTRNQPKLDKVRQS